MRGFGEVAERLRRSTVQVFDDPRRGGGSGVVWKSEGLILTNAHVARGGETEVLLWDGRRLPARVTARDARRDLAALRVDATGLEAAVLTDSDAVRPGQLAMAIGSPLGFAGALSTGVVHSIGPFPNMGRQSWIRAAVQLAPGNSGGPLANALGEVIGINTAVANGLGLAVPSNAAVRFVARGAPPRLGVTLRPSREGLVLLEIERGGAAEAASLRPGDVLLDSYDDLSDTLASGEDVVRLRFLRGSRRVREAFVRLAGRAAAA
jgi:serine protease Do